MAATKSLAILKAEGLSAALTAAGHPEAAILLEAGRLTAKQAEEFLLEKLRKAFPEVDIEKVFWQSVYGEGIFLLGWACWNIYKTVANPMAGLESLSRVFKNDKNLNNWLRVPENAQQIEDYVYGIVSREDMTTWLDANPPPVPGLGLEMLYWYSAPWGTLQYFYNRFGGVKGWILGLTPETWEDNKRQNNITVETPRGQALIGGVNPLWELLDAVYGKYMGYIMLGIPTIFAFREYQNYKRRKAAIE